MITLLDNPVVIASVYQEYPRKEQYPLQHMDGKHNCWDDSRVLHCNGDRDIRRCDSCGHEWECSCNFDDDFS